MEERRAQVTHFVIDASAVAPFTFWDEAGRVTDEQRAMIAQAQLHAPAHWRYEVANMLLVAQRRGRTSDSDHIRAVTHLDSLAIAIDEDGSRRAWSDCFDLAVADNLTIYDAAYLELARRNGYGLLTLDAPLARAARARGIETPLIP